MPYTRRTLRKSVKDKLPKHAQEIFTAAYNNAWERYGDPAKRRGSESREEVANKVAWAAVKRKYRKGSDEKKWHARKAAPATSA